jgi:DNA-binding response OmpR family regulator
MIAHAAGNPWATQLADALATWPVDVHWTHTDREAINLVTGQSIHVSVVDYDLPQTTGLDLVRRMRQMGVAAPCLLVCGDASQRVLHDALKLDIFSVVQADSNRELIVPMVVKVVREKYHPGWPPFSAVN